MVDFGTVVPTSLLTTHVKGLQENEGKTEMEMSHCDRKRNYRAYSEESVAACAQKQRRQKTNKDDINMRGNKQVRDNDEIIRYLESQSFDCMEYFKVILLDLVVFQ